MDIENENNSIHILCNKLVLFRDETGLQWLIGSPFFPPFTVVSTFRCIHSLPSDPLSPDFSREADDIKVLLPRGFDVIGALIVGKDGSPERIAAEAIDATRKLRRALCRKGRFDGGASDYRDLTGAVADSSGRDVWFFVCESKISNRIDAVNSILYDDNPNKYIWERGCIVRCELPIRLPLYYSVNNPKDVESTYLQAIEVVKAKFRDSQVTYIAEGLNDSPIETPRPVIIRGTELDFDGDLLNAKHLNKSDLKSDSEDASCSYFCTKIKDVFLSTSIEEIADTFQISVLSNRSLTSLKPKSTIAEHFPASEQVKLLIVDHKLHVVCYAAKSLRMTSLISKLIVPGLVDQLDSMKRIMASNLFTQHPQLLPYHFSPPGISHPVTVIYEVSFGEAEMKQVEVRRSVHLRLGLPFDRPLLRIANAISFSIAKNKMGSTITRKGSSLLKDVHLGIPSSGLSGGNVSLIQGSYEYHHYLQNGFEDSGWGCAYRSLQTIISWFRLQHYTSVDVPSHREIQECLVEIGDKDPSFVGSREWIGAIELSFVLDRLLGVSCKVINVRSGAELPEKCRELALHFQNQGTPVMIGGGVLAYTLLGVDYDEASGDSAFLILDPHYTGNEDLKKIVNGGWCGWKRAIDSKGKHFFLHDKFYNLLLPQRPNKV